MKNKFSSILTLLFLLFLAPDLFACSVLYYIDAKTGKIYVANNEDYWYDVDAYIQIMSASKKRMARLWYGWDKFAQGGVNAAGLFFDGAVTPEQESPAGYKMPGGNLGDDILALCSTVEEALAYLEERKVALNNGHMMFGDKGGDAVVVEWIDGEKVLTRIAGNKLVMTNFLLADTSRGNYPCYRYKVIHDKLEELEQGTDEITMPNVANAFIQSVQVPRADENGRTGGTLYSSFINISDMEFILVYKIDESKVTKLDLKKVFEERRKRKIRLE